MDRDNKCLGWKQNVRTVETTVKRAAVMVPHSGGELAFVTPPIGPGTYAEVVEEVHKAGLIMPTAAQTVSLLHWAVDSDCYGVNIRRYVDEGYLWMATGILSVPDKGLLVADNPLTIIGRPKMLWTNQEGVTDLEKLMENGDNVRTLPFGLRSGEMKPEELAENEYVQCLVGQEGAEKLPKVAREYSKKPFVMGIKPPTTQEVDVLVIRSGGYSGLSLYPVSGIDWKGYAFGIHEAV